MTRSAFVRPAYWRRHDAATISLRLRCGPTADGTLGREARVRTAALTSARLDGEACDANIYNVDDEIAASLLHQLRTPLMALESTAEHAVALALKALKESTGGGAAYEMAAAESLARLDHMRAYSVQIQQILEAVVTSGRAGRLHLRRSSIGLADLLAEATTRSPNHEHVAIELAPSRPKPPVVVCDSALMVVALRFAVNAVADSEQGDRSLRPVKVQWTRLSESVQLRFSNPRRQTKRSRGNRAISPWWLDALLVRQVVEAHGGSFRSDRLPEERLEPAPTWIEIDLPTGPLKAA